MRRILISSTLGALLFALAASPALAAKPDRQFIGGPFEFVLPSEVCGFDVMLSSTTNNEYDTTFFDQSGAPVREIISGKLFVTLTNVDTGKSIDVNASGPAHSDLVAGENFSEGLTLIFLPGTLFLHAGRYDLNVQEGNGRVLVDVCEALS
jgi:hypothetical protein